MTAEREAYSAIKSGYMSREAHSAEAMTAGLRWVWCCSMKRTETAWKGREIAQRR